MSDRHEMLLDWIADALRALDGDGLRNAYNRLDASYTALVTCGTWRHGAAEGLVHFREATCHDPKPVREGRPS